MITRKPLTFERRLALALSYAARNDVLDLETHEVITKRIKMKMAKEANEIKNNKEPIPQNIPHIQQNSTPDLLQIKISAIPYGLLVTLTDHIRTLTFTLPQLKN